MRILIAADMEGISGVTNWDQVTRGHPEYERFRRIMTGDVNAAVRGAYDGGATSVIVADGHGYGSNVLIEDLDSRARLYSGTPSPFSMLQGIDTDVDGVFFVGYHARAGSADAILDHTWSSRSISNLWLNGNRFGETGLNAAVCGHFNVPVLLISGDQTVCAEAQDLLGPIETVVVKHATGRMSAEVIPPQITQDWISEAAGRAVRRLFEGTPPQPLHLDTPLHVTVQFSTSDMVDRAVLLPGAVRLEDKCVEVTADDMLDAYRSFRALASLARE